MSNNIQLLLIVIPTILIATFLVQRAVAVRPERFRLSDYFLAGGKLGPSLTRANALGSNIALANGLWYFVVLGYLDGALGLTAQITWCFSIFLVSYFVPIILAAANRGETLHGFLGGSYGSNHLRTACAFVTGTGYLLNFGFEAYVSGSILASMVGGTQQLKWVFVLIITLSSSLYIAMAGFLANVSQDRKQNAIGITTIVGVVALVLATLLLRPGTSGHSLPLTAVVAISWTKYLGIFAYTAFFNMVDVSNWQTVAASRYLAGTDAVPALKRAWRQTALLALVFPGALGVALGIMLRSKPNVPDAALFGEVSALLLPGVNEYVRAGVTGAVLMGFFVLALGYAENLLSAAQFTFMADVFKRRDYDALVSPHAQVSESGEDAFVRGCQRWTFVIAGVAVGAFLLALMRIGEAAVFGFMFMIFGSAISMFPAVLMAARAARRGERCDDPPSRVAAWVSILSGYFVAMSPLAFPSFAALSPVFTILVATIALPLTRAIAKPLIAR